MKLFHTFEGQRDALNIIDAMFNGHWITGEQYVTLCHIRRYIDDLECE